KWNTRARLSRQVFGRTSVLLSVGLSEDRGSRVTFQVISQRPQRPRRRGNVSEAFYQLIVNRRVKIAQCLNVSHRCLCPFHGLLCLLERVPCLFQGETSVCGRMLQVVCEDFDFVFCRARKVANIHDRLIDLRHDPRQRTQHRLYLGRIHGAIETFEGCLQIRIQFLEIDVFELANDTGQRAFGLLQGGGQGWDFRVIIVPSWLLDEIDRSAWKKIQGDIEQSCNQALHIELPSEPSIDNYLLHSFGVHRSLIGGGRSPSGHLFQVDFDDHGYLVSSRALSTLYPDILHRADLDALQLDRRAHAEAVHRTVKIQHKGSCLTKKPSRTENQNRDDNQGHGAKHKGADHSRASFLDHDSSFSPRRKKA